MNALSYFEHNAKCIELDVVEWNPPAPIEVEETDDEDTVRIVRMAELNMQQLLDAGLVPVEDAAAALGIPKKRLIGFILRNELGDPIGGWLPDAGMAVYGWSCRHIADTSSAGVNSDG